MFFPGNFCMNPDLPKPQIKQLMYSIQTTQTHCDPFIIDIFELIPRYVGGSIGVVIHGSAVQSDSGEMMTPP